MLLYVATLYIDPFHQQGATSPHFNGSRPRNWLKNVPRLWPWDWLCSNEASLVTGRRANTNGYVLPYGAGGYTGQTIDAPGQLLRDHWICHSFKKPIRIPPDFALQELCKRGRKGHHGTDGTVEYVWFGFQSRVFPANSTCLPFVTLLPCPGFSRPWRRSLVQSLLQILAPQLYGNPMRQKPMNSWWQLTWTFVATRRPSPRTAVHPPLVSDWMMSMLFFGWSRVCMSTPFLTTFLYVSVHPFPSDSCNMFGKSLKPIWLVGECRRNLRNPRARGLLVGLQTPLRIGGAWGKPWQGRGQLVASHGTWPVLLRAMQGRAPMVQDWHFQTACVWNGTPK